MSAAKVGRKSANPFEDEEEDMHKIERRKGKRGSAKRSGRGRKRVEVVDMDDHNDDHCEACHDGGHLLCCDNCDFAFHFTCTQPPLLPDTPLSDSEPWYCRRCNFLMKQKAAPAKAPGPFGALLDLSSSLNPHTFSLPASFKKQTHTEQNKARDAKDLDFADLLKNPEKALARYTADEVSDNRRRRGKSCNICNLTDNQAALLSCDYCRRNYHPYCLNPVPLSDSDWTCPNSTEAKHITKTKRSLSKSALSSQIPPEELTRINYLQSIPFVLDFASGWAPRELPTDGLSVNGVKLVPLPRSRAVPRLMSADAPRKPRGETGAKQTGKRSAARAATQSAASVARQVAEAEEIAAVMHNTPAHHAMGMEWGSMKIDFDSDLFASQYDALLSFLKPASREEAWSVAKTSVVNSATLLRNSTPLNIHPPWTSPAEEQQRFKATVTHASSLAQKCSHASFDDQLLPALKDMMRQPTSQGELLKFLGFQRLEQLYRFGYQVSSHHKAMDKVSEQQQLQLVNPGASSAYLLHLANGIDHAPVPQEGKKRSLAEDISAVPLGPMRKVAKLKEHQGPSNAPLLISVSEEDWDALIDQTLAARNAAVLENSSSRSSSSTPAQSTTTATGRARKNSAHAKENANASTAAERRQSQQQAHQASPAAPASQSHQTPTNKQNQTSAAAAKEPKTPNEAKQTSASFTTPKAGLPNLPGTSHFFVPPNNAKERDQTPSSPQKGAPRSAFSTPASAPQTPMAMPSSSANVMDLTQEGTGTPPISPPVSKQSSGVTGRPKNAFHSDESVHHENLNRNTFTIVAGTGGGAAPIVTPKLGSHSGGAQSYPTSAEQQGLVLSPHGGSAAHTSHQGGPQGTQFIQYHHVSKLRDEDVDYTPQEHDPEKKRKAKQGAARRPKEAKEPKEMKEKEEVPSFGHVSSSIFVSDVYNWKAIAPVQPLYWTAEKIKQLKALRTLDLHHYLADPTHSVLTTLVGKKDIVLWKLTLPSTTIGRELISNVNLLQLGGTKVSREHAVIKHSNLKWKVKVKGKHGIFLNGAKIDQHEESEIVDGDQLDFHFIRLIFRCN